MEKLPCYVCKEERWAYELRKVRRQGVDHKIDICANCAGSPHQTYGEVEADLGEGNDV